METAESAIVDRRDELAELRGKSIKERFHEANNNFQALFKAIFLHSKTHMCFRPRATSSGQLRYIFSIR